MRSLAALLAIAIPFPAAAAEPAHCYAPGKAPADAKEPTDEQRKAADGLTFGYHLIPVIYRRFCEVSNADDEAYLTAILNHVGCSRQSQLGKTQFLVLESDDAMDLVAPGLNELAVAQPGYKADLCGLIDDMPWPIAGPDLEPLDGVSTEDHVAVLEAAEKLTLEYQKRQTND